MNGYLRTLPDDTLLDHVRDKMWQPSAVLNPRPSVGTRLIWQQMYVIYMHFLTLFRIDIEEYSDFMYSS